jgi:hypothetical protein
VAEWLYRFVVDGLKRSLAVHLNLIDLASLQEIHGVATA